MLTRHFKFEAHPIGSYAATENIDSYEENMEFYKENKFSYIPIPDERKFYDIQDEELREMSRPQLIDYDTTVRTAVDRLTEVPFLFFEDYGMCYDQNQNNDLIITAADLNKRAAKEMMYSVLADLENRFAELIEQEYPDSQSLFAEVSPTAIGRWVKAGVGDVQMHLTEYMTLSEMIRIIAKSDKLRSQIGFESRNQFDKQMSGVVNLRNRVMHTSRTIIEAETDIEKLKNRLERAEELL